MGALRTGAVAIAAVAAMLAAACTSRADRTTEVKPPPSGSPTDLQAFYQQKLGWADCKDGFQCSTVRVPRDYAKPDAGEMRIAVIRLPARDKANRVGSLLTNPGGPGGSGVDFVRENARSFGPALQSSFDIIGFDPRGVGNSDPVRCLSSQQLDRYFATDSSPDDQQEVGDLVTVSKGFANGCQSKAGSELPYIGTVNAARDIDVIRAALGDKKLTYLGFSYGTYLGAFYAQQFPKNVRALVLDGAVDPKLTAEEVNVEQAKGFETALRAFAANCVRQPDCPLGTGSVDAALDKVTELQKKADRTPLRNTTGDGRQVTEALATLGIATALYSKQSWPALKLALTRAIKDGDGTTLLKLGDILVERKPDGSYSNQTESNMAINCVDKPYPDTVDAVRKESDEAARTAPRFAPFVIWGSLPCTFWPAKPKSEPKALTADGAAPILVIGTTRDPATPYKWAQGLASQLQSGVLLSLDGDGHTAYLQGNACISRAVEDYLINDKAPKDGTMCR
ncbi:MAG: alpha/beta hydrolase [Actinomadura sp.]